MTPEQIREIDKEADAYHVMLIRQYATDVIGGNCTNADDDLHMLVSLAYRAAGAGMTDGMDRGVRRKIAATHASHLHDRRSTAAKRGWKTRRAANAAFATE